MALVTVIETNTFLRDAAGLFSESERGALVDYLSANPFAGDEIRGSGGVRKVRFAVGGRGKSSGARVIYFIYDLDHPLILFTCYGKSDRANLSDREVNELARVSAAIKTAFRRNPT